MRRLHAAKLLVGGVLAVLSLGVLAGLLYLGLLGADVPVEDALLVPVRVTGPGASVVFLGEVEVPAPTAYAALRAAARAGNFTVHAVDYGDRVYVDEIAGHKERGASGWVFAVSVDEGDPCYPAEAADRYALRAGQALAWRWSDEPVPLGAC